MEMESDPLINQELGSYRVEVLIGVGGMGRVYRGVHQALGRNVAIKLLPVALAGDSGYMKRFVREAQIAAQLNHPNLIACYDFGESPVGYYFVMEYVEGESVADWLIAHHRMKVEEAIPVMQQVCLGLGYAHSAGIIHRDIKPDNILLTRDGMVKVADLGLAKVEDKSDSGLTQLGMAIGTPNYISPEQVRGEIDVDWRSDIYSLGATMFHCVTGKIPYDGNTPTMIMTRHVNDPVPIARQVNPDVHEAFSNLLLRMMQKDPHMRIANCEEVLAELDKMIPRLPSAAVEAVAPAAPKTSSSRMEKEGLLWIKFGAFILAAVVIGGGYLIYKSRHESPPPPPSSIQKKPKPAAKPAEAWPPAPASPVEKPSASAETPKPPSEKQTGPRLPPEAILEKVIPTPPVQKAPQMIGVRDAGVIKTAEFMGAEAEAVTLGEKERLTLTSQQNVFLHFDFAGVVSVIENHLGRPIDIHHVKVKLFVIKCAPLEATLAVRIHRLTADPRAGFQYHKTPLKELSLKPTERGYFTEFDATEEFRRCREGGENYGLVLMTSQGGEAVFASALFSGQKSWPAVEVSFVPAAP